MQTQDSKKTVTEAQANAEQPAERRPNESGTVRVEAHMRIFDPKTQTTFVEGRA